MTMAPGAVRQEQSLVTKRIEHKLKQLSRRREIPSAIFILKDALMEEVLDFRLLMN